MATLTPRTTPPTTSNAYYFTNNPFYNNGWGMPNCTCYAYGRYWEAVESAGGTFQGLPTGNAGEWYPAAPTGLKGSTPKVGAILCHSKSNAAGHVAFVEEVVSDNEIIVTDSQYTTESVSISDDRYFRRRSRTNTDGHWDGSLGGYRFQGFIYSTVDFSDSGGGDSGGGDSGGGDSGGYPTIDSFERIGNISINYDANRVSLTVYRTNSPAGEFIGALEDGDDIYRGDSLEITFSAKDGYESAYVNCNGINYDTSFAWLVNGTMEIWASAIAPIDNTSGVKGVYIHNGTNYERYLTYIDNGTSWDLYTPWVDTGTTWVEIYPTWTIIVNVNVECNITAVCGNVVKNGVLANSTDNNKVYTFIIHEPGEWIVSATKEGYIGSSQSFIVNGSTTNSELITSFVLKYPFYIVNNGVVTDLPEQRLSDNSDAFGLIVETSNDALHLHSNGYMNSTAYFGIVNITNYSTLTVYYGSINGWPGTDLCLISANTGEIYSFDLINQESPAIIDVTDFVGEYLLYVTVPVSKTVTIYDLYFY